MTTADSTNSGLAMAVDVAARRRDAARQQLAQRQLQLQAGQDQLDQLEGYADDSDARWAQQAQQCALPELMHHHYQFMGKLFHAIALQRDAVRALAGHADTCRVALLDTELRLTSLKKLVQQRALEGAARLARRDQKEVDELAARMYRSARDQHQQENGHAG